MSPGVDSGPKDLSQVFQAAGSEIFGRWCYDEADSCGFNGHGHTN